MENILSIPVGNGGSVKGAHGPEGSAATHETMKRVAVVIVLLFTSVAAVIMYSRAISPIWDMSAGTGDSTMFEVIGREWARGAVPYISYWDSKGPYVFFVNMLGYLLGGRLALCSLEALNLFVTKVFMYKTMRLRLGRWVSLAASSLCVTLTALAQWNYGNTQSGWCMPFIAASIYLWVKSIEEKSFEPRRALVHGLAVGICLMSRPSNALPVLCYVLAGAIWLARRGEWRNLLANLGFGIAGIALPVIPFSAYFAAHGAFGDMMYAIFTYNFAYADHYAQQYAALISTLPMNIARVLLRSMPTVMLAVVTAAGWKKDRLPFTLLALPLLISLIPFFKLLSFPWYLLIYMPVSAPLMMYGYGNGKLVTALSLLPFAFLGGPQFEMPRPFTCSIDDIKHVRTVYNRMVDEAGSGSLLIINENLYRPVYIERDISPCGKFFYYQDSVATVSDEVKDMILSEFDDKKPEYVIYTDAPYGFVGAGSIDESVYRESIYDGYDAVDDEDMGYCRLTLYRRKGIVG
jgi:hypothetical protein